MSNTFFQGGQKFFQVDLAPLVTACIPTAVHGHPQLSVKCRLPNRISLTFTTGTSAKLKRGHMKRYAVALSV